MLGWLSLSQSQSYLNTNVLLRSRVDTVESVQLSRGVSPRGRWGAECVSSGMEEEDEAGEDEEEILELEILGEGEKVIAPLPARERKRQIE